jgi:hypothetical protein
MDLMITRLYKEWWLIWIQGGDEQIPFLGGILENSSRKTQELLSDTAVAGGVLCPEDAAVTMAKAT